MKACIGSSNEMKLRAARRAFRSIGVSHVEMVGVESGVPPQPVGLKDIVLGSINRARQALSLCNADFGVGVESGLTPFPSPSGFLVFQLATVIDSNERVSTGISPGFELYDWENKEVSQGVELSKIVENVRNPGDMGEHIGYIGYMTHGIVTRFDLTYYAIIMALKPWIHGDTSRLLSISGYLESLRTIFGLDL